MASSYTGLYVQKLDSGQIHSVQVEDLNRNSLPMDPNIYKQRKIQPPIDVLIDQEEFEKRQMSE